MKHLIGVTSDTYKTNNEFGIDFEAYQKHRIDSLDYQGLINFTLVPGIFDWSENEFIAYFNRLHEELVRHNLIINQLHALWEPYFKNLPNDIDIFKYHEKAILAASLLKTKYVVVHAIPIEGHCVWDAVEYEKIVATNKDYFKRLSQVAKKLGVNIAVENLPFIGVREFFSPSGTLKFVEEMNDPNIVMCLDTGHFNIFPEEKIYDFLLKAGDKIGCLHIHDNNGNEDSHLMPLDGTFDWKMFIKGLKNIGFAGVLSLEVKVPTEKLNEKECELFKDNMIKIVDGFRRELDEE